MKRLLYIAHRVPFPPDKGERVRAFHEIVELSTQFDVTLAALTHDPADAGQAAQMAPWCSQVLCAPAGGTRGLMRGGFGLLRGKSITEGYFHSGKLLARLRQQAVRTPFDVVFAYCSSVLPLALGIPAKAHAVDLVDVDSAKWQAYAREARWPKSVVFGREARGVRKLERQALASCDAVFVVSEQEARLLENTGPQVLPITNGVDSEYFSPQISRDETPAGSRELSLVFVGQMDYAPNEDAVTWFVEHVWPTLRDRFPSLAFEIVGRDPSPAVRRLATVPGVIVTGTVPDVRPYVDKAAAVVAPLRIARGIQNKVLEAMAMGKAVIASPQALEGIDATPGEHALVADSPADWADQVGAVLEDPARRGALGQAARQRVTEKYVWSARLGPLVAECERIAEASRPAPTTAEADRPAHLPSRLLLLVTGAYALLLATGSLLPSGRTTILSGWDQAITPTFQNALHVPAYTGLYVLATVSAWSLGRSGVGVCAGIALACLAYGALMEVLQAMIPGRTGSLLDMLLNAAGIGAGCVATACWTRKKGARPAGASNGSSPEQT